MAVKQQLQCSRPVTNLLPRVPYYCLATTLKVETGRARSRPTTLFRLTRHALFRECAGTTKLDRAWPYHLHVSQHVGPDLVMVCLIGASTVNAC
jgi:hypothetical protein